MPFRDPDLAANSCAKPARPFGNLPGRVAAPTNELGIRPLGLASKGPGIKRLFGFIQPRTSPPPREALVQTREPEAADNRINLRATAVRRSEAKGPPSYICLRPTGTSDNRLPSVPKRGRTFGSPPATCRSTCSPRTIAGPGLPDTDGLMWPLFGSLRHAWQQLLAQGRSCRPGTHTPFNDQSLRDRNKVPYLFVERS